MKNGFETGRASGGRHGNGSYPLNTSPLQHLRVFKGGCLTWWTSYCSYSCFPESSFLVFFLALKSFRSSSPVFLIPFGDHMPWWGIPIIFWARTEPAEPSPSPPSCCSHGGWRSREREAGAGWTLVLPTRWRGTWGLLSGAGWTASRLKPTSQGTFLWVAK